MSHPPPPPPEGPGYGTPPPPYGGYPPAPGGYGGQPVPAGNKKALWSLILGIAGVACCSPLGVVALVLGFQARQEISRSRGMQTGDGQAIAGIVLGMIGCLLLIVGVIVIGVGGFDLDTSV